MTSRTTDDYEAMYAAGVRAVVEPAFWLGQPRTNVGSFTDYFDALVGWERFRAAQFGIRHHCTIALNPKEANDSRCAPVLEVIPRYLAKDGVVAVGEIGYDSMTAAEDVAYAAQLAPAREHGLPALVHTPHRDKLAGTRRSLAVIEESGIDPGWVVLDHLNEVTAPVVADTGCWLGFSIYPDTKMDPRRMVALLRRYGTDRMLVNSAAGWSSIRRRVAAPGSPIPARCSRETRCCAAPRRCGSDDGSLVLHQRASGRGPGRAGRPVRPVRGPGAGSARHGRPAPRALAGRRCRPGTGVRRRGPGPVAP